MGLYQPPDKPLKMHVLIALDISGSMHLYRAYRDIAGTLEKGTKTVTTLIAIDALIFNPDKYLPHVIFGLTVLGLIFDFARALARKES